MSTEDDSGGSEPISLKLRRGLRADIERYARGLNRNLNSQMEFWARILVASPDLTLELEKRANALATSRGDEPPRSKQESPPGDRTRLGRQRGKVAGAR